MLKIAGGDQDSIYILEWQEFFEILKGPRRSAVVFLSGHLSQFAIRLPKIADRSDLDIELVFQERNNSRKLATAPTHTDVAQ
jgi:hypothetical protein